MIEVFSTARQVREFYESFKDFNVLLPKAITIAEFESKAWILPNLVFADEDARAILMREAAAFANFEKLRIPKEFMAFLQNRDYIFRFFEELAGEEVDISELEIRDTYAEFSEHISILKELRSRYCELLLKNGLYDRITLPRLASINGSYLSSLREIRIRLEGFPSRFELRLIAEAQKFCTVFIVTPITAYNKKVQAWLRDEGINTRADTLIECDLNARTLLKSEKLYISKPAISFQPLPSRALQAAFVFAKIEAMIKDGIEPENIAVVLPDESFAPLLRELDRFGNLNFAMGFGMNESRYYQRLQAILKRFNDDELEHRYRLSRFEIDAFEELSQIADASAIISWLRAQIRSNDPQEEQDIINEELFLFERFLLSAPSLTYEQAVILFSQKLSRRSKDDKNGGKVTVIGILESRGVKYDGVIIVDFNDDIVPKRNKKDMFISSFVRSKCNLPSTEDRENLQRFFYDRLINNARSVALACVENDDKLPSRFLKTLPCANEEFSYDEVLFARCISTPKSSVESFILSHDFFEKPLSNSRLKCFLECQRRYYFKYIKHYEEAEIPSVECDASSIGTLVHDVLKELFSNDIAALEQLKIDAKKLISAKLRELPRQDAIWELESDIWQIKLEDVFAEEIKRRDEGWRVFALEQEKRRAFEGIYLEGRCDRIDRKEGEFLVLDYKTGKLSIENSEEKALNSCDFQLEFYALLCEDLGDVKTAFYDLNEAKIVSDPFFELKKEKLKEHIGFLKAQKEFEFVKTTVAKHCEYCPFTKICGGIK